MTVTDTKRADEELLTLDEVAQLLKVTRPQVLELTRKRTQERSDNPLPVIRFHSKMLRVRRKDFVAWVEKVAAAQTKGVREIHATTAPKGRKLRHRFSSSDIERSVLDHLLKRMKKGG
jgi:predicted DNA-binding transcriptional regulator AlpA